MECKEIDLDSLTAIVNFEVVQSLFSSCECLVKGNETIQTHRQTSEEVVKRRTSDFGQRLLDVNMAIKSQKDQIIDLCDAADAGMLIRFTPVYIQPAHFI